MRGKIPQIIASVIAMVLILSPITIGQSRWQAPFDSSKTNVEFADSVLSFDDALRLVASENRAFRSFQLQLQAAQADLKQVGLWANPELSVEFEEVGWDSPGFKESEFTVALSQEFEFFGKRKAEKSVARSAIDATNLRIKQEAFDLYLETKERYYALAYAQENVILSLASVTLVDEIVNSITDKLNRGAALQSELLLARLEQQRAQLALNQAKQEVKALEVTLVALWNGKPSGLQVSTTLEAGLTALLDDVATISNNLDSSRAIVKMRSESEMIRSEKRLAIAEAKPTITLSGGFKRFEVDNSKSVLFGVSLPIPLLNRNQGRRESLDANLRSLEYDIEQTRHETEAILQAQTIRLHQLVNKHAALDSLLLPTAEEAYRTLQSAYEAGRVPYTQLLEAERHLNELSFEHNDIFHAIQQQIIALEHLTGVVLRVR